MEEKPNPLNSKLLIRTTIAGLILAFIGVAVFGGMWILLGEIGLDDFPRLVVSFCLPPAAIAGIIGAYMLIIQPKDNETNEN